ncbi:Acyl-coenzyme A thioesterase 8 [Triticum urartu]|uniref:Cyclic nucleotide-binding domain-containing protein n=2 Tax=Triticum TaxID=4564 RepID=A0A9R1P1X4_TRITD|nr:Acyl-coenzyme A thioesterase 8 [Triticum urartu]VAH35323.1 unnamed protein product [Triticum turgidum subsp. durum]
MDREQGKAAASLPDLGATVANSGDDSRWCAVTEFLGQVPLLQCLPGSSIRRIAEAVQVKHYEPGDYVAREGEPVDGLCIILDGQAEVSAPANTEEANRPDYVLNKYDYFGYGTNSSVHQVNVIAVTKLSCFVLPSQYGHLLQTKTIWNAEETPESHSLMEQILHLEKLEVDIFRGFTLPEAPTFNQVFGGQLIGQACFNHSLSCCHLYLPTAFLNSGQDQIEIFFVMVAVNCRFFNTILGTQALAAASKTVDCLKLVHSLHAIFLIAGDNNIHSFLYHMLSYLSPDSSVICRQYRNSAAKKKFVPWPIEMRFCQDSKSQHEPRCVVAYASDLLYSGVSLNPHRKRGLKTYSLSLDHSMWFHKPVKADDWLLYVIDSPSAHGGRGFVTGRMFNRQGEVFLCICGWQLPSNTPHMNVDRCTSNSKFCNPEVM